MNENIDLTKILKDCPMGWKFYSSVYGEVEFIEVYRKPVLRTREDEWLGQEIRDSEHPIRFWAKNGNEHSVSSRGEMIKGAGECTFFPSRDQRDWSKFTAPWHKKERFDPKTLKVFDKVLARVSDNDNCLWFADFVSTPASNNMLTTVIGEFGCDMVIPYNDETKHLVGTTEEAPEYYKYWEE